jgi:AraC family transcriptional regulator
VLRGGYEELAEQQLRQCESGMLIFHPAGEKHANRFGNQGGACFNLEFGSVWPKRIGAIGFDKPATFSDPATVGLAARLRNEFLLMDDVSGLAIEALALELVVAATRRGVSEASTLAPAPRWLTRTEEMIRARFTTSVTLIEIAATASRHPTHLARQFRTYYGCSIGDYIRRLRIREACRRLTTSDEPLAMIALGCGFSSQAHFSTLFKRVTGLTPAEYRRAFRSC